MFKPSDLVFLDQYLDLLRNHEGIRILVAPPEDYIELLRENLRLREENKHYNESVMKYGQELYRAIAAEDKLKYLHGFLDDLGIIVPGFRW